MEQNSKLSFFYNFLFVQNQSLDFTSFSTDRVMSKQVFSIVTSERLTHTEVTIRHKMPNLLTQ